ncbi:hypothetical protein ISN45_Aa01g025200 [Arabidopsis thaliana x Arabidopsis arenosa]|uniref:DUF1985 domain-containing protein n=1 Tax=Arabidopsis thaliana x Arabidopsis arenosa TaxID=1240361 RepID=A0A8T2C655_9BRAS|nr:hypothetical protein ISN45_Aa01g025200 [Arabidopsis thaliana x Arabidopsis arenosa]
MTDRYLQLPPIRYKIGEEVNKPAKGINNFSSFEYLNELRGILGGSLFSRLENTFLGPIIIAGSRKGGGAQRSDDGLGFSGQLIHFLLSRQIKTTREEVWFHFDGQPMRFSLREFHLVTGLPCWETEEEEAPIEDQFVWPLCNDDTHTCGDLLKQIKELGANEEEGKLRLAMLLLIESIFLMPYTNLKFKFPRSYVEIARSNITSYPWGEVSFKILISSINSVCDSDLNKGKYSIKGFPMALQLWFLASVPNLEVAFARLGNPSGFVCARYLCTHLPTFRAVWVVERSKDAKVISVLGDFDDKNDDLAAVVTLVNRGYRVSEIDWSRNFIDLEEAEKFISLTCGAQNDGSHETNGDVGEDTLPSPLEEEQDLWCVETLLGFQDVTKSSDDAHPSSTKAPYQTRSGRPIVAPSKFTPDSSNELKHTTKVQKQRLLSI